MPQDPAQGSNFPQRGPEDGLIDWRWNAGRIRDFVRAQTRPYPGAFFLERESKVVVWSAAGAASDVRLAPGEIRNVAGRVLAGTGEGGALQLVEVQVDGRDVLATSHWPA